MIIDNDLIRLGLEALACVVAAFLFLRKHKDLQELIKVMDKCEAPNEEILKTAIDAGMNRGQSLLKKFLLKIK